MQMLDARIIEKETQAISQRPFNLLRWFSVVSLSIIASVAIGLGYVSTRFVVTDSVERDAMLTAQFIQAMAQAEVRHARIIAGVSMGELLDPRNDGTIEGLPLKEAVAARTEFFDHIKHLPDTLLANAYADDRTVIWSTNPELIGRKIVGDEDLEESFKSKLSVSASYHKAEEGRDEQRFEREPRYLFIENYIPMFDATGTHVVSMVEIYKEPQDLVRRIQRGYVLIWGSTILGGLLIYLGLFWIVRRAAGMMQSQQSQLIASETFVALGEMSSAVAHSLRNPLATIRSSAELAHEVASLGAQKNIGDIISQVDRMSRWVRDLLASLRPVDDDAEAVDLLAVLEDTQLAFAQQAERCGVRVEARLPASARVISQKVLLTQILNSLFSNALEAMPKGGRLSIEVTLLADDQQLQLTLSDTGKGMSEQQERMVFKPFFTTKQGGLGVGLMLVKRIMERFGGAVSLTSRQAEGTRVCLTFKLAGGDHGTQHSASGG